MNPLHEIDRSQSYWTDYPEQLRCAELAQERGWYAKEVPGQGFVPGPADDPDGMLDLNRAAVEIDRRERLFKTVRKAAEILADQDPAAPRTDADIWAIVDRAIAEVKEEEAAKK